MSIKNRVTFIDDLINKKDSFFCDICNYPFCSYEDFKTKNKHNCCFDCYLKFIEARKKEWNDGWRPTKETIADHIKIKKELNSSIITIKEMKNGIKF